VKAVWFLAARTVVLLAALPLAGVLIAVVFHPDTDGALGFFQLYVIAVGGLIALGITINERLLRPLTPDPPWLRFWYVRLMIRLVIASLFFVGWLVTVPN
jgi:hypothetical protein